MADRNIDLIKIVRWLFGGVIILFSIIYFLADIKPPSTFSFAGFIGEVSAFLAGMLLLPYKINLSGKNLSITTRVVLFLVFFVVALARMAFVK